MTGSDGGGNAAWSLPRKSHADAGETMTLLKWLGGVLALITLVVGIWYVMQPGMDEVGISYAQRAGADAQGVTVKWYGVTTLLIDDGETQLLIDGYFSRPGLLDLLLKRPIGPDIPAIERVLKHEGIDRLAVVIPVHSHFDHAMDSAEIAKRTGARLLGSTSTANIGRSSNLAESQIQVVELGEPIAFGGFSITFFPSQHAPLPTNAGIDGVVSQPFELPAPYTAWQLGEAYSIFVEHSQGKLLVQGSAGFVPGALKDTRVDAVFLGVGGLRHLSSDYQQQYIAEMVGKTGPGTVYVVHHDNLFAELGNVEQSKLRPEFYPNFAKALSQWVLPAQLRQLKYGEPVLIGR